MDVTLTQADATDYNFATGTTVRNTASTTTVRGVLFTETKRSEDGNIVTNTLIIRSPDIGEPDIYDTFVIAGKTYKMSSYADNGFTTEFTLQGA